MRRARALLPLLLLLPMLLGIDRPRGLGDVADVRTWSHPNYTRVVVELTRRADAGVVKRLAASPKADRPERLYVDLEGVWVGRDYIDGIPIGDGLLRGVRLGQNKPRTSRLVIDLERYERHRLLTLQSPPRLVIDVYGDRKAQRAGPPGERDDDARLSMPLREVRTVVIDAGHGGKDPGAIGVGGLREKDVNLAIAKQLERHLQSDGFEVVHTRKGDSTLDLEQRTAIAEAAGGDLFVSIHANSSPRRKTRGIEIYYLDREHERHSLDVAARENGVPRSEVDSLQRTIAKLRVSEASLHSSRLAHIVHEELMPAMSKQYRGVADLGVKTGPFYVLFLASMPSILVETGFVTNREDAKLLRSDGYVELLAARIARGLGRYRRSPELAGVGRLP